MNTSGRRSGTSNGIRFGRASCVVQRTIRGAAPRHTVQCEKTPYCRDCPGAGPRQPRIGPHGWQRQEMRRCWQSCVFTLGQEGRQEEGALLRSWKLAFAAAWPPNVSADPGKRLQAHREQNNREAVPYLRSMSCLERALPQASMGRAFGASSVRSAERIRAVGAHKVRSFCIESKNKGKNRS